MELFATDLDGLAFFPETGAALDLDFEGLEAAAQAPSPPLTLFEAGFLDITRIDLSWPHEKCGRDPCGVVALIQDERIFLCAGCPVSSYERRAWRPADQAVPPRLLCPLPSILFFPMPIRCACARFL